MEVRDVPSCTCAVQEYWFEAKISTLKQNTSEESLLGEQTKSVIMERSLDWEDRRSTEKRHYKYNTDLKIFTQVWWLMLLDRTSARAVDSNTYTWLFVVAVWASSQHGAWLPRISVPREPGAVESVPTQRPCVQENKSLPGPALSSGSLSDEYRVSRKGEDPQRGGLTPWLQQ
ncbi:zinc finger protein 485 isoform X1 [Elephas maximus indicus]|uniref:zinc finger protein 485 isoform X1 n=1 Tax=Elephas maximus indicus TaxID=99487 RepID=UPI002117242C|nr:zinc finger protein 485 isoform X1 [Elephas maximus indicus]XP_049710701.1 zinc finger protein 485 isoform X1 [Elephas maximus indicus]XP_049710702.1 zinc finger protein 485 isoform X1 [Elephas maximus indicus]XP_049710703.1 zinc finger protein 485 isoform X1 [Elephas maximus indicus]